MNEYTPAEKHPMFALPERRRVGVNHNPLGGVGVRSLCLDVAGELKPAVSTAGDQGRKGRKSFASVWSRASSASTQPVPNSRGKKVELSFEAPIEPCIKRPLDGSKSDASASLGEGAEPTLTSSGDKGRRTKVRKGDCFLRHWIAQLRR